MQSSDHVDQVPIARMLKAKQAYRENAEYHLILGQFENAALYARGLALLQYLTEAGGAEPMSQSQGNISAAMTSIWTSSPAWTSSLTSRDKRMAYESLLTFAASLLHLHATRG
jgi:hypothetical protein